jgi:hypothetical protein
MPCCCSTSDAIHSKRGEISDLHREADENRVILGYYTASNDNSFPTFRQNLSAPLLAA